MKAITREEKIMSGENLTPITRKEMFLAKASGQNIETPTPITREEYFLSKITGGGGSTNLPLAYTVSSVDELPSNAVDGSMAIVPSDSLIGEWEWKDNESPLDFSMLNLPTEKNYIVTVSGANGYETLSGVFFEAFTFSNESGELILSMGDVPIYENNAFTDTYTTFEIYTNIKEIFAYTFEGIDQYPFNVNKEQVETFFAINCNRLSGGYSLYTHENGQWVYKCEVV